MKTSRISAVVVSTLAIIGAAAESAKADTPNPANTTGPVMVLNSYSQILPKMIGDAMGPTKKDPTSGAIVPRVGRCTGVGFMDPMLKLDDSPAAAANFATDVPLLIIATTSANQPNQNSNNSYMQAAFTVTHLTVNGPDLTTMSYVDLPRLNGDRTFAKANIMATNKYYFMVGASEDNGRNNNPQAVAFVYDKTTLKPVTISNTNRSNSLTKPTNLIELSGLQDDQQWGAHSIARVTGTDNSFVMGLQRNNNAAYVMRVNIVEDAAGGGVKLDVQYLNKVIANARHCRPQVTTSTADGTTAFLTSVEANNQPADIGVRALSFDVSTGKIIKSVLVAKSDPRNNKYAVQPEISNLGSYIGISYQMSEKTRKGPGAGDGQGHTGGSNLSMLVMLDKTTLAPVGDSMSAAAPYARHAGSVGIMWGEDGKEMPTVGLLGGSSIGTGKGFVQMIPVDTANSKLGTKDPAKLYEVSTYSDIAGTVVRGKRNPQDQGRGFIYAAAGIPNPGYNKGNTAFMPEVKTLVGSAVQGYTSADTAKLAARESIYLSLIPSSWIQNQPTTPGGATGTPGTAPDGSPSVTGPLPRVNGVSGTSTDPNAPPPASVIPGGDSPDPNGGAFHNGLDGANSGCSVSSSGTSGGAGGLFLVGLGLILALRRKQEEK